MENLSEITPEFIEMSQPEVLIPLAAAPSTTKSAKGEAAQSRG
jgi:hypothetical protein